MRLHRLGSPEVHTRFRKLCLFPSLVNEQNIGIMTEQTCVRIIISLLPIISCAQADTRLHFTKSRLTLSNVYYIFKSYQYNITVLYDHGLIRPNLLLVYSCYFHGPSCFLVFLSCSPAMAMHTPVFSPRHGLNIPHAPANI